jgi:hypothetical protein
MSDCRLKITKDGLKTWRWDGDLRQQCVINKHDGHFSITRKDGTPLGIAPTRDAADEYFWKPSEEELIWPLLRNSVTIDSDVTIEDINRMVQDSPDLRFLCERVFRTIDYGYTDHNGVIEILGEIEKGILNFIYSYSSGDSTNVTVCDTLHLRDCEMGQILYSGEYSFSFLEVLRAIYAIYQEPVTLGKNGLKNDLGEVIDDPLPFLFSPVVVEADLTVADIFDFVASNEDLKMLISCYSWCRDIDAFHAEAKMPLHPEVENNVYHAETYRVIECHPKSRFYDRNIIDTYVGFHGVGRPEEDVDYGNPRPETINYSLSGSSANEYVHLPFRADETAEIRREAVYSRKGSVKEPSAILATVKCPTTLLELLDAIYDDISFYGGPSDRNEFIDDLCDRVEECKNSIDGKRYISVDEMMKDILGEEYNEMYPPEEE